MGKSFHISYMKRELEWRNEDEKMLHLFCLLQGHVLNLLNVMFWLSNMELSLMRHFLKIINK
jgi:hypothetical protein